MIQNKYTNKKKNDSKRNIIIILIAVITMIITLFCLKSCFSSEIKANDETISESSLISYQQQIDELTDIDLNEDNRDDIQRRILKIKELLDNIPSEYIDLLDLDDYQKLIDYLNENQKNISDNNSESNNKSNKDNNSNNNEKRNSNENYTYKIEVLSNNRNYGVVSGGGSYKKDEIATLQAKPNGSYIFISWDDGNKENPRKIKVTENKTFTASFSMMCSIKTAVEKKNTGTTTGEGEYLLGSKVVLTAYPNENYEFDGWTDGNNDNPRTIIVDKSQTYVATFHLCESNSYVTVSDTEAGYVTGGDNLQIDETVTLTAIANKGYKFIRWSDGNTENPRRIKVKANTEYKAVFEPIVYNIQWDSRGLATLSFTSSTATIKTGIGNLPDIVTSEEYKFVGWYTDSLDYNHTGGDKVSPNTIPNGDETYYAVFAKKQMVYRSSSATGQSETMSFQSISGSSCWVPNYPKYYVSTSVNENYVNYETNAAVCGVTRVDEGYHCHVYDFDRCSWTTCSNASDEWECCCGTQYSTRVNACNVTHSKTCPGYYEITGWSDWGEWSTDPINNIYNANSYQNIVKVEAEEKYLYDDSLFIE